MNWRRVLAYARVSSQEQGRHGTSLDGQQDQFRAFCAARGLPTPTVFIEVESGGSEKIERRYELRRLLKEAQKGDLVLVWAVDRWSRDIVFAVDSVRKLVAQGIGWFAIREYLDASTPQGDQVLGIMAWSADVERHRIKERTVGRRRELRAQGKYVMGRVPYGYRKAPGRTLAIVEEEAAWIREAFRLTLLGHGTREVARLLSEKSGERWTIARVAHAMHNRTYLGVVVAPDGTIIRGTHPAIIDEASFERARADLAARQSTGRRAGSPDALTRDWLLAGIARCGRCGEGMGPAFGSHHTYYMCQSRRKQPACGVPYLRVDRIDALVAPIVVKHLSDLERAGMRPAAPKRAPAQTNASTIESKRKKLEARLERATSLAVDGAITSAELKAQRERIDRELLALSNEEAKLMHEPPVVTPEQRAKALQRIKALRALWERMSGFERREVIRALAKTVRISGYDAPQIDWRTPEELAEEMVES